jgi:glycyl-tRNA synthetase (class II)
MEDDTVTIRDRDAMTQERVPVSRLIEEIANRIGWTR